MKGRLATLSRDAALSRDESSSLKTSFQTEYRHARFSKLASMVLQASKNRGCCHDGQASHSSHWRNEQETRTFDRPTSMLECTWPWHPHTYTIQCINHCRWMEFIPPKQRQSTSPCDEEQASAPIVSNIKSMLPWSRMTNDVFYKCQAEYSTVRPSMAHIKGLFQGSRKVEQQTSMLVSAPSKDIV